MNDLPPLAEALRALGGAELLAWLSVVGYAIAWIMTCVPPPSRRSSRWWKRLHAALNVLAGNVGRAKNKSG